MSASKRGGELENVLVGVDFGTTKVCVIVGKPTHDGIEIVGIGRQPSLGIRKGMVVNIPQTVEAVRKASELAELMAGCSISKCYAGIAGSHVRGFNSTGVVAVKNKEITADDVDRALDAARAVTLPTDREVLHVIPQEFVVNEQEGIKDPVGMVGVRLESRVHIVTGAAASAQNLAKCATQAGIQISGMVLEPLASAEAVLTSDEKELGVALVDMGGGTTDIAVFVRGNLVHTSVIGLGGNHITNDIAVGLRTSIQDAENIKLSAGCAMSSVLPSDQVIEVPAVGGRKPKEFSRSVLAKIIEPRVEEIFALVDKELVGSGYKHLLSCGVVLTGGGSLLEGIAELSEFLLELPVRRGVPQGVGGLSDVVSSPVYSTAVGLLMFARKSAAYQEGTIVREDIGHHTWVTKVKSWLGEVF